MAASVTQVLTALQGLTFQNASLQAAATVGQDLPSQLSEVTMGANDLLTRLRALVSFVPGTDPALFTLVQLIEDLTQIAMLNFQDPTQSCMVAVVFP